MIWQMQVNHMHTLKFMWTQYDMNQVLLIKLLPHNQNDGVNMKLANFGDAKFSFNRVQNHLWIITW